MDNISYLNVDRVEQFDFGFLEGIESGEKVINSSQCYQWPD